MATVSVSSVLPRRFSRFRFVLCSALVIGLMGAVFMGCRRGSGAVEVPPGRFVAVVEGAVTDTLRGQVHYRMREGDLVGFELGARDRPGLSIELQPMAPASRTYRILDEEVLGADRPGATPGGIAFLVRDESRFAAVEGTLDIKHVDRQTVAATFSFGMKGRVHDHGEETAVLVTGRLNAPPE